MPPLFVHILTFTLRDPEINGSAFKLVAYVSVVKSARAAVGWCMHCVCVERAHVLCVGYTSIRTVLVVTARVCGWIVAPAWAGGGGIKPHRLPHRVYKDSTIIGFAHSKHHHKSYTVIKQSNIDETEKLLIPQKMSVNVEKAAKRHKHNLKDSSYHGSHYY